MGTTATSGSAQFDMLKAAFAADPALRQETEWAYRLAVETYNPSDRGLRFITGGIGEWIITLAAYQARLVTLPEGHNADGHDILDLLQQSRELWSVKTSYQSTGNFTITNGQNGPGPGLVVSTVFLAPLLPGIVYVSPDLHPEVVAGVIFGAGETRLRKRIVADHGARHPECVIPFNMPANPGAAIRDPGLEAVRLLLDGAQFPRLRAMFQDTAMLDRETIVTQLRELRAMRDAGDLTQGQYVAAVERVTGITSD